MSSFAAGVLAGSASCMVIAAIAAAFPACAQQTDAQRRTAAFADCRKEADRAVPTLRTAQDDMNHYIVFSTCLEKRGYVVGAAAKEFNENR